VTGSLLQLALMRHCLPRSREYRSYRREIGEAVPKSESFIGCITISGRSLSAAASRLGAT